VKHHTVFRVKCGTRKRRWARKRKNRPGGRARGDYLKTGFHRYWNGAIRLAENRRIGRGSSKRTEPVIN